jgi:hypothetical protein
MHLRYYFRISELVSSGLASSSQADRPIRENALCIHIRSIDWQARYIFTARQLVVGNLMCRLPFYDSPAEKYANVCTPQVINVVFLQMHITN